MKFARVIYTRAESRANPDYQVIGASPATASLVDGQALEGFFRTLLGQPDTLRGFTRACFFAPIREPKPGHPEPIWIAGIARPSDKPDRHGRRGILNYSVLAIRAADADAIHYDPWPLFEPAIADAAFPFIDDPDCAPADFEWPEKVAVPPAPAHAPGDLPAEQLGETMPEMQPESDAARIAAALQMGDSILVLPHARTVSSALSSAGADAGMEALVRDLYRLLPAEVRARVAFLTHSFRPATSVQRFQLLAAPCDVSLGESKAWVMLGENRRPLPHRLAVDVRRHLPLPDPKLAGTTPVADGATAHGGNRRVAPATLMPRTIAEWLLAHPLLAGSTALAFLLSIGLIARACTGTHPATVNPGTDAGEHMPSPTNSALGAKPSNRPGTGDSSGSATGNRNAATNATGNENSNPDPATTDPQSVAGFVARWNALGVWNRELADDAERTRFSNFADEFFAAIRTNWADKTDAEWPAELQQLAAQISLTRWKALGRPIGGLQLEAEFHIRAERLDEHGPVVFAMSVRDGETGAVLFEPVTVELRRSATNPEERSATVTVRVAYRYRPGALLDIEGFRRHDRLRPERIHESFPLPAPTDWFSRAKSVGTGVFSDAAGTALRVEIVRQKIMAPPSPDYHFPAAFWPQAPTGN